MTYFAPYFDNSGLNIPTYIDIRDELIAQYKSIYGQDCYLEEDSADYQWISIVALRMHDALNSVQLSYNNRAPQTAVGSGLDQIVKMNGLARKAATYSTCDVTLTGTVGVIIYNGVVSDVSGKKWSLPEEVELVATGSPEIGQATVTATCQELGLIPALPHDIINIVTPTFGWTGVDNITYAVEGAPVETDAELRLRQSIGTTLPAIDMVSSLSAAIAAIEGVNRYRVQENDTNAADVWGNPAHSVTCVVEGGSIVEITDAIWFNKGIGCLAYGGIMGKEIKVTKVNEFSGVQTDIAFQRPEEMPVFVKVYYEDLTINGLTVAMLGMIKDNIVEYLNSLQIGQTLTISALYSVALSVLDDIAKPTFSIKKIETGLSSSPLGTNDMMFNFNEVTKGLDTYIELIEE